MPVTLADVEKIAALAKLNLNEGEKTAFIDQINKILSYVGKLNELATDDALPLSHALETFNVFREDVTQTSLPLDEALANAPQKSGEFFKVPKVIGK